MNTTLVPSVDTVNVKSNNQFKSHFEYCSKISEISTFDFVEGTDIKEILVPGNSEKYRASQTTLGLMVNPKHSPEIKKKNCYINMYLLNTFCLQRNNESASLDFIENQSLL